MSLTRQPPFATTFVPANAGQGCEQRAPSALSLKVTAYLRRLRARPRALVGDKSPGADRSRRYTAHLRAVTKGSRGTTAAAGQPGQELGSGKPLGLRGRQPRGGAPTAWLRLTRPLGGRLGSAGQVPSENLRFPFVHDHTVRGGDCERTGRGSSSLSSQHTVGFQSMAALMRMKAAFPQICTGSHLGVRHCSGHLAVTTDSQHQASQLQAVG